MKPANYLVGTTLLCSLAVASSLVSSTARADDLKLKDGSKISGTIVGFEDNSFKVKTSYGFALVQKDQVVSINVADAAKPSPEKPPVAADAKVTPSEKPKTDATAVPPAPVAAQPASAASQPAPVVSKSSAPVASASSTPAPAKPAPSPAPAAKAPVAASPVNQPTAPAPTVAANVAPPKPAAPEPAKPEPIKEEVTGNTYTNETYRFHMYKPPDWDVIASAPAVLPGAITAMGTADDTTYLLIGQQPAGKSLALDMDTTEHRLHDVMENFRPLGEEHISIPGATAVEHRFRGTVDQHDWSGVVVLISRGGRVYTIFGMTRADNDLVQLQENVISRAISSLQFTE